MNITINFFEVVLSKDQITVPYLNFNGQEQVNDLRNSHSEAIFLRSRDKLFFWGTDSLSAEGVQDIDKAEDRNLLSNILAHSLLQQFYQPAGEIKIRKAFHIYQITFFDNDISANKYQGIKLYKTFHVHFTPFFTSSGFATGFTVSTSVTGRIAWTIHDFEDKGIQYDDLLYDEETGRVFMNPKALYRLAHHFNYASRIKEELDRQNAIQREFGEINSFVEAYFKSNLKNFILPDELQAETISGITYSTENHQEGVKIQTLPEPECYFYRGIYPRFKNNFHKRQKIGYNKPFSYDEFENRTINISIIYPKSLYQDVRMFFKFVQYELIGTFKLKKDNLNYDTFEIEDFTLKSYQKTLSSIKNTDLVVVVVDKAHEALKSNESPYSIFVRLSLSSVASIPRKFKYSQYNNFYRIKIREEPIIQIIILH